ncbi:SunS family peptide S-glycosyltransferase (plasmid) [Bacillus cereus]|uniref:SunS family peptide S-glycosyltransferase n=1 Tax=Bacillus cereus TaxID=1396 RepID=UPI0011218B86|nr:SunS family peptide S-glycosyltransferase [Bacillus cereus]UDW03914.1 SunS family peptide S-glycosyltransferase [Bacillus cereus]
MNLYEFYQLLEEKNPNSQLFQDMCLIHDIHRYYYIDLNFENEFNNIIELYEKSDFPSISCGIITYNEERCIHRCLDSLINEFSEIVVLDSMSNDKTVDIIRENFPQVKVISESWKNDFSYQRNKLINYVTNDWIYFIDADNYFGKNNTSKFKRIARLIEFFNIKCVISPIIHEYTGDIYTDTRRMFSLNQNISFYGKVHEEPIFDGGEIPDNITVKVDVYHDGYDPDIVDMVAKNERNLVLTKEMIQLEPGNPKWLFFYARELNQAKSDKRLVENVLLSAIDLYKFKSDKRFLIESLSLLCKIYFELKDFKSLIKYISVIEEEYPDFYDIEFYKASLLLLDIENRINTVIESLHVALDKTNENTCSTIHSKGDHFKHLLINLYSFSRRWDIVFELYNDIQTSELKQDFLNNVTELKSKIDEIL